MPKLIVGDEQIDGIVPMLAQQAYKAYQRLPEEHRRWQDPEDMLQQALLTACNAATSFDKTRKVKFSTYAFTGVQMKLNSTVGATRTMSRRSRLVELDVPSSDDSKTIELVSKNITVDVQYSRLHRAYAGMAQLCRAVSAPARVALAKGFLLQGRLSQAERALMGAEVQSAVRAIGLGIDDLRVFSDDENSRKFMLTRLIDDSILGLSDTDTWSLQCAQCGGAAPLSAVREERFFLDTMLCRSCYRALSKHEKSCFGKDYSVVDKDCTLHCRDKVACLKFVGAVKNLKEEDEMALKQAVARKPVASAPAPKRVVAAAPKARVAKVAPAPVIEEEVEGADLGDMFEDTPAVAVAPKVKRAPAAKSAAGPKRVAAPKAAKVDENPAPKEVGGEWPWRSGSAMTWSFQQALKGIPRASFDKQLKASGTNPLSMLKVLRTQRNGTKSGKHTHSWKFSEEGDVLKITGVKFHASHASFAGKE